MLIFALVQILPSQATLYAEAERPSSARQAILRSKKSYPSFAHYENKDDFSVSKTLIRLQRSK
jgi:hypothetical protein